MHIEDFHDIHDDYDHVYLSPHLDDGAISCGGAIVQQRRAGEQVLVVALCTATPAADTAFSELAQEFHRIWQLSPAEAIAMRLREERTAIERLDADSYWAGMFDAIYRYPQAYHSRETLFGTPHPDDPLLPALRQFIAALRARVPSATIYAPLGIGSHVDHLITYRAALDCAGDKLTFYEDFPYAAKPGALDQRLAALDGDYNPQIITIDTALRDKIGAIAMYPSQLDEVFGGAERMAQIVTNYAATVRPAAGNYGERIWLRERRGEGVTG
jgi:LmbE family N-acetylglucosaminyl deacetylase